MEISRYEEPSQAYKMMVAAVVFISGHVNHTWVSLTVAIKNGAKWHVVLLWIMKDIHVPFSLSPFLAQFARHSHSLPTYLWPFSTARHYKRVPSTHYGCQAKQELAKGRTAESRGVSHVDFFILWVPRCEEISAQTSQSHAALCLALAGVRVSNRLILT